MKDLLGEEVHKSVRGILYICDYTGTELKVLKALRYNKVMDALDAYANTRNPESQLAMGKDADELSKELTSLHSLMSNKEWIKDFS